MRTGPTMSALTLVGASILVLLRMRHDRPHGPRPGAAKCLKPSDQHRAALEHEWHGKAGLTLDRPDHGDWPDG